MNIEQWLRHFHDAWKSHDIPTVLSLFTDDVEYWETPYQLINSKQELEKEWQVIELQQNIQITSKIFSSSPDNKYAAIWSLSYTQDGEQHESSGAYLIGLNNESLCNFFYFVSTPKK